MCTEQHTCGEVRKNFVLIYMAMYECVHRDHTKPVPLKLMRTTCFKYRNCSSYDEDILTQWSHEDSKLNIKQPMNTTYAIVCDTDLFPLFTLQG